MYIPKNLEECFEELINNILFDEDYCAIKSEEEEDLCLYHHSLGRYLRNEWGLWHGSRLAKWFNDKGINHADDMSAIILTSFWREINSELIRLDEQIKEYQLYWEEVEKNG